MKNAFLALLLVVLAFTGCTPEDLPIVPLKPTEKGSVDTVYMSRAETIFTSIFSHYWSNKVNLMFGSYPNVANPQQEPSTPEYNVHAYLWGFGGALSAFNAIVQHTPNTDFRRNYEAKLKSALIQYYTPNRNPAGFACFVNSHDKRLYDDAIWVGIDLVELYNKTKDSWYLDYAKIIWGFIMSGKDDVLGGGIYWEESPKNSKNTCSNAPAAVLALRLYETTNDEEYLTTGKEIYDWVKLNLQDPKDKLYWDNKKVDGTVETWKFSYNSGQMIQAGVLLYNATKNERYLNDAKIVAEASYNEFFNKNFISAYSGERFPIIKDGHLWFNAIMVRGFIELNKVEENGIYMTAIRKSLEHGWKYSINPDTKLIKANLSGTNFGNPNEAGDILYQGAIAEMFAKMAVR